MANYPFEFDPGTPFMQQASDWIADVFYEVLPEAGFEVRDEQIYMAFQLERAYNEKKTIFAEAGVGTGKTLVYLLYAICYARYTRKPAIIACADESLIEQLVKPEGDIAKLARHLELTIDARLGKSPDQYICLNKLDDVRADEMASEIYDTIYSGLPKFVHRPDTMQSFHPYGNRKDYPELSDDEWGQIGWDVFQDCLVCNQRHRCGQTLSREHYRKAADIIICSHDFYMEHVWTYDARKREGQLPLLPEHSSVVFDEGHLLETAAQSALTYKLKHSLFESIITRLLEGEVRESLAYAVEDAIGASEKLFELLAKHSVRVPASNRREVVLSEELLREINRFSGLLGTIEEELVFESGLFTIDDYQLKIVEEHLEMIGLALSLFKRPEGLISWVTDDGADGITLVIMPRKVKEILAEMVFGKRMPVVFSSATLSVDGSFDYVAQSLGISDYLSFTVASPYNYEEQMKAVLYPEPSAPSAAKMEQVLRSLEQAEGGSLLLFPSFEELHLFQAELTRYPEARSYRFLYEGSAEISHLISEFQRDERSILCAVTLWEGLDIPGPSLSHVLIWALPFPPHDPVFDAKRKDAKDAFREVDMPYMLLRMRQGIGRLIRTSSDSGTVSIFGEQLENDEVREQIMRFLPSNTERMAPC
ncbi:ATP-dependent DNA helicase DinG [Paenibacillus cellulosilyticus]|uniref:ATP-dependent DNA helicase DinG n=1 Tax=Paenibacillus cellulosilyticus TaxID=375489 RepID=A0A2V2YMZ2_9BACL|nr:ATP-dependent DNA helicase [Paenibacillus cellulosilyticus]PWV95208.1 ATP-dependent DNA helicase DinG [Paenibacillus cellulosilyticus]QKS46042.1 ATP-dependent DNA helicase [Paenibacillus cellulosilyticus]